MSDCMNKKKPMWNTDNMYKPCIACKFCPYGAMVEQFPINEERDDLSCDVFGHDCPVFYLAEPFMSEEKLNTYERFGKVYKMIDEFNEKTV